MFSETFLQYIFHCATMLIHYCSLNYVTKPSSYTNFSLSFKGTLLCIYTFRYYTKVAIQNKRIHTIYNEKQLHTFCYYYLYLVMMSSTHTIRLGGKLITRKHNGNGIIFTEKKCSSLNYIMLRSAKIKKKNR